MHRFSYSALLLIAIGYPGSCSVRLCRCHVLDAAVQDPTPRDMGAHSRHRQARAEAGEG